MIGHAEAVDPIVDCSSKLSDWSAIGGDRVPDSDELDYRLIVESRDVTRCAAKRSPPLGKHPCYPQHQTHWREPVARAADPEATVSGRRVPRQLRFARIRDQALVRDHSDEH